MIKVFNWMKGTSKGNIDKILIRSNHVDMHGNGVNLGKYRFRCDTWKYWFMNRVVYLWNGLPRQVVGCNTVNTFKIKLDEYMGNSGWL